MPGLQHFLCGNFLGHFDDHHESPPASDEGEDESEKELYMPRDYETPPGKAKKGTTLGRAARDWAQYRKPIVVETHVGKEVLRSQFVGIRIARRELAPGMVEKLAMQVVHTIEIIQCKLKEEPPLSEMQGIVVLKLSRNELTCLSRPPKSNNKPLRLETLACDRNKLQQVEPGALSGAMVASLQVLDLSRNQLSFLPGDFVAGARQLKYLDLSHNQLFGLPDSILKCYRLLILNVDSNEIEQLPSSFGQLTGLRKLTASYNNLTSLPESIGECVLLEKIRVVNNHITVMPYSLLQLWKQKGGALEELLVDGNPLVQPSITAFQMGGLDQALRLFGEWISSQEAADSNAEIPVEDEEAEPLASRETVTERASVRSTLFDDGRQSKRESTISEAQREEHAEEESDHDQPSRPGGDPDDFRLEDLELEVVQVIDESGKRLSKFSMTQSDLQRLQEGSTKTQSDDLLDPYYFSHVEGDIDEILSIRSAESAILLLKKRYFVLRQQDIAMELAKAAPDAASLKRDLDRTPELWDLFRAKFDCMLYNGKVPVQDLDLYFCMLVYGSKPAFTSIHALWDKFEVGEKGHMTKDEWYNLCTRVRTKLPKHAQLDIWNLLAWRDKIHLYKADFVAGWHIHDPEVQDAHVKSIAENLHLEYYGVKVEELQERIRMRLAEDSHVSASRRSEEMISLPRGEGERWMKREKNQVRFHAT